MWLGTEAKEHAVRQEWSRCSPDTLHILIRPGGGWGAGGVLIAFPSYPLPMAGIWRSSLPATPARGACAGGERILRGEGVQACAYCGLSLGTACPCSLAFSVLPFPVGSSALMSAGGSGRACLCHLPWFPLIEVPGYTFVS